MMQARIHRALASCGRLSCGEPLGTVEPVKMSGRWYFADGELPPRWRRTRPRGQGQHQAAALAIDDTLDEMVWRTFKLRFDGVPTEPVIVECPRCRAVQQLC